MVIKLLGEKDSPAALEARKLVKLLGHAIWEDSYYYCDLSIAPLLTTKLGDEDLSEPRLGTLIFHPSPLPYGRGSASIRWAYHRREPITAATWFWADSRLDTGDICEQEIIKIDYTMSPKEFYETHIISAMLRTLERCLDCIQKGYIRRVPQVEEYASFDLAP